jgi:hypothetical protein
MLLGCFATGAAMDIKGFLLPNDTATDVRASDKTRLLEAYLGNHTVTCVPTSTTRSVGIWK